MMRLDPHLQKVFEIAEPLARTMGLELLYLEEVSERGRRTLRLYLDRPGAGVTIDDCADFSRALDPILDVEGPPGERYHLEVSSPGVNRPLVKPEHFGAHEGAVIEVATHDAVEERRHFKGRLLKAESSEKQGIRVEVDKHPYEISYQNIKKAHLDFFATQELKDETKGAKVFRRKKGKSHGA